MSNAGTRPRITNDIRKQCLSSFKDGNGYKRTARITGVNVYTVREYLRRYKAGDTSWAERGPAKDRMLNS